MKFTKPTFSIIYLIFLFSFGFVYSQDEPEQNYQGEIDRFNQTENFTSFSTIIKPQKYFLYVMDRNDSTYFIKQFEERPLEIIVSEIHKSIFVCFSGNDNDCESYKYKMYNLYSGENQYFPPLHTKLKLAQDGKYLFSSIHLFDNSSPLDIFNLETNEHFVVDIKWSKVSSISANKLVVLERLSERNKQKLNYIYEMSRKREAYFNESSRQRLKYKRGKISFSRFAAIDDSLKEEYKSLKSKEPRGNWTQLGTKMWIYDLESKSFIFDTLVQDEKGNPVILNRDEQNSYTLDVDEKNNIYINGLRRHQVTNYLGVKVYLKYNSKYELDWSKTVDKYSTIHRK